MFNQMKGHSILQGEIEEKIWKHIWQHLQNLLQNQWANFNQTKNPWVKGIQLNQKKDHL